MDDQLSFLNLRVFLRNNRRTAGLALLCSIGVTMTQLLLALLLGAYFEVGQASTSSKGFLLHALGIEVKNYTIYFSVLLMLIAMRGLFAWAQRYTFLLLENEAAHLQKRAGIAHFMLHGDVTQEGQLARALARIQSVGPGLTKWATEGVLRPLADGLFVVFVAVLMAQVNTLFASVFFGVVLLFGLVVQWLSQMLLNKSSKAWSRKKAAFTAVKSALNHAVATRMLNREKPVLRQLHKYLRREWRARQQSFARDAYLQALAPVGFFCAMLAVLWCDFGWSMGIAPSVFLVFILLSMYVQGAIRRLMKTPYRWAKARVEVAKWKKATGVELDRTKAEKIPNEGWALQIESMDPTLDVHLDLPLMVAQHQWLVYPIKNRAACTRFLNVLAKVSEEHDWKGRMQGQFAQEMTGFQIRKHVAFVGLDFPLDGQTVAEAVCYSEDKDKHLQLEKWMAQLHWENPLIGPLTTMDKLANGSDDYFRIMLLRALMTKKRLLVVYRFFDEMSKECAEEMKLFLKQQTKGAILEIQIKTT